MIDSLYFLLVIVSMCFLFWWSDRNADEDDR